MHPSALANCRSFFSTYAQALRAHSATPAVIEVGSQDVNGSLRREVPADFSYTGVDFVPGPGVDLVLADAYTLPFADASCDAVLSSSVFEHCEMFWVLFLDILRVLKPHGLFYLNVPSNGDFHRYPVDCWRFYPDSGNALVAWARRNGLRPALLESYTSDQADDQWNDFVAVFLKDGSQAGSYPQRILHTRQDFHNGLLEGHEGFLRPSQQPQDRLRLQPALAATRGATG